MKFSNIFKFITILSLILFLSMGSASAVDQVFNGGFETGDSSGWEFVHEQGSGQSSISVGDYGYNSDYGCRMLSDGYDSYGYMRQEVNFTDVNNLQLRYKIVSDSEYATKAIWVSVGGIDFEASNTISDWVLVNIDVSSLSGTHNLDIYSGYDAPGDSANTDVCDVHIDNIVVGDGMPSTSHTMAWESTEYGQGDTGVYSYYIDCYNDYEYDYFIKMVSPSGTVNWYAAPPSQSYSHQLTENGVYTVSTVKQDLSTLVLTELASDNTTVNDVVNMVSWDKDPYVTGDTAQIATTISVFDDATYSYYLELHSTNEYLTTYPLSSATESNSYTFPTGWDSDTNLFAELIRVDGAEIETRLAHDMSHFETSIQDSVISFDQLSYNPGDTLTVSWSGAPSGSIIWLRAGGDGDKYEYEAEYTGNFQYTVPTDSEETYYLAVVSYSGQSQAQADCVINCGYQYADDYIHLTGYNFSDSGAYSLHNVERGEYLNVTTETNINVDFVDVYYNNVFDNRAVSVDHIEDLSGTEQIFKFPNDLGSGQYITIIIFHNITTGTNAELSYYTNVGEAGEGIDIYNTVITLDDTGEIIDTESIPGYTGNDLVVPLNRVVIFDIYTDEIINSTTSSDDYFFDGDVNYNSTSDHHMKRSYLFTELGLANLEFTVHNDETNTDDTLKYKVYVEGIDQGEFVGNVVMYWVESKISVGDNCLLYYNVTNMPENPILTIDTYYDIDPNVGGTAETHGEFALDRNRTGTEKINTDNPCVSTATMTCNGIVYAVSVLTVVDPSADVPADDDEDDTFSTAFETMLSNGAFIALIVIIACVGAFGRIGGVTGVFLGMVTGISISFLMGYLPAWILFVMVLALCVVFVSKLIDGFGGGD